MKTIDFTAKAISRPQGSDFFHSAVTILPTFYPCWEDACFLSIKRKTYLYVLHLIILNSFFFYTFKSPKSPLPMFSCKVLFALLQW